MSRDFHAYLEHYNDKYGEWEEVTIYIREKNSYKEVPFIDGGWGDLEQALTEYFIDDARIRFPIDLSSSVVDKINELYNEDCELEDGIFGLGSINVADLKINILNKNINDSYIMKKVLLYAEINDLEYEPLSSFRIIYWGDC